MKLIGDMSRTETNIDALRRTVDYLAARVEKFNETTTKEYFVTTTKINVVKVDEITHITKETTKMKVLLVRSSRNFPSNIQDKH